MSRVLVRVGGVRVIFEGKETQRISRHLGSVNHLSDIFFKSEREPNQ